MNEVKPLKRCGRSPLRRAPMREFKNCYVADRDHSGLEVVQPMFHDLATLIKGLLVHAHDDGCVRVAVVVDVDWELLDADIVEGLDHLELILPQRKGGELEARARLRLLRGLDIAGEALVFEYRRDRLRWGCQFLAFRTQVFLLVGVVDVLEDVFNSPASSVEHERHAVSASLDSSSSCLMYTNAVLAPERLDQGVAQKERGADRDEDNQEGNERNAGQDSPCRSSQSLDQSWCGLPLLRRNRVLAVDNRIVVPRYIVELDVVHLDEWICLRNASSIVRHRPVVHYVRV